MRTRTTLTYVAGLLLTVAAVDVGACLPSCLAPFGLDTVLSNPQRQQHFTGGTSADSALAAKYAASALCFRGRYTELRSGRGMDSVYVQVDSVLKGRALPAGFWVICDGASCCSHDTVILNRPFISFSARDSLPATMWDVGVLSAYGGAKYVGHYIVGATVVHLFTGYNDPATGVCWFSVSVARLSTLSDGVRVRDGARSGVMGSNRAPASGSLVQCDLRGRTLAPASTGAGIRITRSATLTTQSRRNLVVAR